MPDARFFKKAATFSLAEIAQKTGAALHSGADPNIVIEDVMALDQAEVHHLSFLDNVRYREQFHQTKAGACFVAEQMAKEAPKGTALLISNAPYKAYALAAQMFYPENLPEAKIDKNAHVHPEARIGKGCVIDALAVVGRGAEIGAGCWIEPGAVVGENVRIGAHCRIGPNASVSHCLMGDHVRLYPGARIGQDGFGFAIDPKGHVKVPQLGRVIIEDHVEVGANSCIDRGAGPDTVIGQGTWIDNLVQIGHNVKIGKGCVIVAQVGIAGSAVLGDFVAMGGQSAVAGHLHIGSGARIAAQSGVMRNVPAGQEQMGSPSLPMKEGMRQIATLNRLIKKGKTG